MGKDLKSTIELLILGEMFGLSAFLYFIFISAYLHPKKISCIAIDTFGEANIEIIILSFFIIIFFGYILYRGNILLKEIRERNKN